MKSAMVAAASLLLAACGSTAAAPPSPDPFQGSLSVFAAASLTESFGKVAADLQKAHSSFTVTYNFNGSSTLATQLQQGAPGDVFASADQANMDKVTGAGLATTPEVFARNRLEIVVAPGNPKHIASLADLAQPGLLVVLGGPTLPAGKYAQQALTSAGVTVRPVSLETDVKAIVSKVELGEADAGIVYVTDVKAAGTRVSGVTIPDSQNVVASYPVAALKGASNPKAARAFVGYLTSAAGARTLESFGFQVP